MVPVLFSGAGGRALEGGGMEVGWRGGRGRIVLIHGPLLEGTAMHFILLGYQPGGSVSEKSLETVCPLDD